MRCGISGLLLLLLVLLNRGSCTPTANHDQPNHNNSVTPRLQYHPIISWADVCIGPGGVNSASPRWCLILLWPCRSTLLAYDVVTVGVICYVVHWLLGIATRDYRSRRC